MSLIRYLSNVRFALRTANAVHETFPEQAPLFLVRSFAVDRVFIPFKDYVINGYKKSPTDVGLFIIKLEESY